MDTNWLLQALDTWARQHLIDDARDLALLDRMRERLLDDPEYYADRGFNVLRDHWEKE